MRHLLVACAVLLAVHPIDAQTRKTPARRPAPARKAPAPAPLTRVPATYVCPSELGDGVTTKRRFCDVLIGRDPAEGIVVTVPPHRGTATLSFELHNRHTYSAELVRRKVAYRHYTATIGVLLMDGTLVDRGVVDSEFRSERDLFDRVTGGAGPSGVKAVAPIGSEYLQFTLPEGATEVSILGERLTVVRPDGTDQFTSSGRPAASISNVMIEYRPAPAPRPPAKKRG
ncbi:MAG: hypothetical protein AB7O28_16325 [Vicinamibacterales bacterium]